MKKLFAAILLVAGMGFWACQKEYSYETETDTASTGAWEFKDSASTTYAGNSEDFGIDDSTNSNLVTMNYTGYTPDRKGMLTIGVIFPTSVAAAGTYTSAAGEVSFSYAFPDGRLYVANPGISLRGENITVVITQITDTSVTGTFTGRAVDKGDTTRIVKEGKFTYKKRGVATTPTPIASTGTLGTTTDTCTGAVLVGTYKKGIAMTSGNTVTVSANVTSTGTYIISSDTIKGIYFRGSASFNTTGTQSVVIPAMGTPTDSGTVRFRLRYGTSSCTFQVKIDTSNVVIVVPPTGDYFPTTTNSNWGYDIYSGTGAYTDSMNVMSTGTTRSIGSNAFNNFVSTLGDTILYRKASGTYYEGIDLDPIYAGGGRQQGRILIESTAVNGTWADTYSVNLGGNTVSGVATYTVLGKPATASVVTTGGTKIYADVIQVRGVYTAVLFPGVPATTVRTITSWYARGVGLIYLKDTEEITQTTSEIRLRRYQIF